MESEEVPLRRRAGAAGIAACVSAVVVNPLDVVKTRMQAQGFTHVSAATPFRHVVPAGAFPPRRPLRISLAPGCPPRCPTTGNPTVTRLLCAPECNTYPSTIDVVRKILRQEGPRALFRGTGTALAIAVPTVGIYLPCYDIALAKAREALSSDPTRAGWVGAAPIVAGAASRTIAVLCVAPLDLVRTRTQAVRGGAGGIGLWAGLAASAAGGGESAKGAEGGADVNIVRRAASRGAARCGDCGPASDRRSPGTFRIPRRTGSRSNTSARESRESSSRGGERHPGVPKGVPSGRTRPRRRDSTRGSASP